MASDRIAVPYNHKLKRLEALLAGVTEQNLHGEIRYGPGEGERGVVGEASRAPDRGDIAWISLNPQTGHEQAGRRPPDS